MTTTLRLGLLALCDAAPVLLAAERKIFKKHGIDAQISVEPSWANIADKLSYGLLDGALMLPPLALACAMGLRGPKAGLVIPMSLSANGNAITFSNAYKSAFAESAGGLRAAIKSGPARLRLAVVHGFSTHDLLLRYWLAASGIDPDRDVDITVLPPSETVGAMAAGQIDGFCAGAPWGQAAEAAGTGFIALHSGDIWRQHPEKCLAIRSAFAAAEPGALIDLLAALREAGALCADPAARPELVELLVRADVLNLPPGLIARALDPGAGGPIFGRTYPDPAHGIWFAEQMIRWRKSPPALLDEVAGLYRPDLYLAAGGAAPVVQSEDFIDRNIGN